MAKKIFDCFTFYNELELLKIRLQELYDLVDFFVIVEATRTFRGELKPLYFDVNRSEFLNFSDKIIHVVVDDLPAGYIAAPSEIKESDPTIWNREHYQRNAIRRGLITASPEDIIIISDIDEIISRDAIRYIRSNDGYFLLDMSMYQFFLNMRAQESGWRKPFGYTYRLDDQISDYNAIRTSELATFKKFGPDHHYVHNAGWHFTFLGGAERVKRKLMAYSHTEGWQRQMWDDAVLSEQMIALREVGGGKTLKFCSIDNEFPIAVQKNIDHLTSLRLIKDPLERLRELEMLWAGADARYSEIAAVQDETLRRLMSLTRVFQRRGAELAPLINMVSGSKEFSAGWNGGMQSKTPDIDLSLPAPFESNFVLKHWRDAVAETPDPNVGYFNHIPVLPDRKYTASCYILIPPEFPVTRPT